MEIPPGFIFLTQIIPRLLLLPAAVFWVCKLVLGDAIPRSLQISACLLGFSAVIYVNGIIGQYRHQRQAKLRGAVLAPRAPDRWPGGIERLLEFIENFEHGYIGEAYEKMFLAYGRTLCITLLLEDRMFTSEPEHIKAILATQFNAFVKGPLSNDFLGSLLGTGVFNSDGDVWKFHRSMTRPFFNKDRVSDFDIFDKHAEDAIGQIKTRLREGYPVDFQDMASRFTMDSATEFLLGKNDPAILNHPANRFAHAFHKAQAYTLSRCLAGSSWRMGEFLEDKVKKHMKVCYKFIDPILEEALEKKNSVKRSISLTGSPQITEAEENNTLLEHLVNFSDDPVLIRDETVNIMLAGRDTTATTMTLLVYMLSQHPKVLHRLREEILSKLGPSRRPTLKDIHEMKYMRAVINETLRLYPPVPFNARVSCEPAVLPGINGGDPIFVPANTSIILCLILLHRRTDLWGPDALDFDPDRFLDERLHKYLTPNPFIFVPFIAGPRICLGQQFAYNEMSFFLVRLLQNFSSISLDLKTQTLPPAEWAGEPGRKGVDKVIFKAHITVFIQGGLWLRMEEASTC